jgi:hypothetical protein
LKLLAALFDDATWNYVEPSYNAYLAEVRQGNPRARETLSEFTVEVYLGSVPMMNDWTGEGFDEGKQWITEWSPW